MEPGVIVVHNLPKDFAERELRDYFVQFGPVTRLRVSRSRKTRGTRGYAYVEFQCKDVAEIAAQSMNNYLMFGRSLKCEFLPSERVHPKMFDGSQKNQITTVARHKSQVNKSKTTRNLANILKRRKKMLKISQSKLAGFGIKFQPVIINCSDENILDISIKPKLESIPKEEKNPASKKASKKASQDVHPLETITLKAGKKASRKASHDVLPLETITLKARKKVIRKRLRTDC